uniref:Zinc transporter ZIP13-like n=1 Tax=Dermatophagoides pteronyssinus TaxID=6956 RepID=A0A6P6YLX0_DERPT|nr:zinc transporter ZIP13-like [Dermatophagoides pteronyssinus]
MVDDIHSNHSLWLDVSNKWSSSLAALISISKSNDTIISNSHDVNEKITVTGHTTMFQLYLVTIASCCVISFSSMLMLLIFLRFLQKRTVDHCLGNSSNKFDLEQSEFLKLILAFAVGALIADVFLHILPEACGQLVMAGYTPQNTQHYLGVWILIGVIIFATTETFIRLIIVIENDESNKFLKNINDEKITQNGDSKNLRNRLQKSSKEINESSLPPMNNNTPTATGYLNLLANGFDNFTHGMSVAASFLVSYKMGIMTTIAIALHEMPHEVVDFVILIRSGFTCWRAFKAQLSISIFTIIGSLCVLYCEQQSQSNSSSFNATLWILPLTSGGFLYIALTSLLPELLNLNDDQNNERSKPNNHVSIVSKSPFKIVTRKQKIYILSCRLMFVIFGIIIMESINAIDL